MKSTVIDSGRDRTFVLVFEPGEEVIAGLLRFATEQKLGGAHLTAIGAFERVTLGFFELQKKAYKKIPIDEQVELMSLVGNIALSERGEPRVHAHVVVGKSDGTAHGGHLLDAYVRPTLEVVLVESAAHLCRTARPELGLALLDLDRTVPPRADSKEAAADAPQEEERTREERGNRGPEREPGFGQGA